MRAFDSILIDRLVQATPSVLCLPLQQGAGVPALPEVAAGEHVAQGQRIASCPDGKLGAHLHAPESGVIDAVTAKAITIRTEKGGTA